jgi:hypothetical protein
MDHRYGYRFPARARFGAVAGQMANEVRLIKTRGFVL